MQRTERNDLNSYDRRDIGICQSVRRLILTSLFLWIGTPVSAGVQNAIPPTLADFAAKVQATLRGDKLAFEHLVIPLPDWSGHASDWKMAVLPLPVVSGAPSSFLAVFSRFHGVQSTGDLLFSLEKTAGGWGFGKLIPETETEGFRVRDHRFNLRFDLPRSGVFLTDEVTVEQTGLHPGPCLLRLSRDMHLDALRYKNKQLPSTSVPGVIAVVPPKAKRFTLSLTYHREHEPTGGDAVQPTGVVLLSYWYPHIARLPATHGLTVSVPKGWSAVSQGELIQRETKGLETRFTFRNSVPTCYFALAAAPYRITSRIVRKRKLSVYQLHPDPKQADQALTQLAMALTFFEAKFGAFPYTHYDLVEAPGKGSALEAYSFALFSGGDFGPLVHELSHTWWGGLVPNPYTTSLWNESFAEYSAGLFDRSTAPNGVEAVHGLHGPPDLGRSFSQRFFVPIANTWDLFTHPGHAAAAYVKGPIVLGMLEDLLGTDVMTACLHRFCHDHLFDEAADWPEFEKAVENVTGRDYRWFFAQWLRQPGAAIIRLIGVNQHREGDHFVVTGTVMQQRFPYRLTMPVLLELTDGTKIHRTIEMRSSIMRLKIDCPSTPLRLRLDPDGTLLMAASSRPNTDDPFVFSFPQAH